MFSESITLTIVWNVANPAVIAAFHDYIANTVRHYGQHGKDLFCLVAKCSRYIGTPL